MPKLYVYQRAEDIGIPVVDGGAPVMVAVTAHDVINAKKANSKHCALSRASLRIPGVQAAYFFRQTAYLEYADRMARYVLPGSVQKEIVSFDRAQIFAPGVYQLTPPPRSMKPAETAAYRRRRKASERRAKSRAARAASVTGGASVRMSQHRSPRSQLETRPITRRSKRSSSVVSLE